MLRELERRLGHTFRDGGLLERALTHRSHAHESEGPSGENYERLEFLGDALLGFAVSDWLVHDDPDAPEGVLTRRRQSVVQTGTLAAAAERLGLGEELRLGRGEDQTGGRRKTSLLADTFEAVVAALYLDAGLDVARRFILKELEEPLRATREARQARGDFKTRLQERVQGQLRLTPRYRIVKTSGPPHALEFDVEVLVGDEPVASGTGRSRKDAEQDAARRALATLSDDELGDDSPSVPSGSDDR